MTEATSRPQRQWVSTGDRVRIDGDIQSVPMPEFDSRSGSHFWVYMAVFKADPEVLGDPTREPMLDPDTLITIQGPMCSHCASPYSKRNASRRCTGRVL